MLQTSIRHAWLGHTNSVFPEYKFPTIDAPSFIYCSPTLLMSGRRTILSIFSIMMIMLRLIRRIQYSVLKNKPKRWLFYLRVMRIFIFWTMAQVPDSLRASCKIVHSRTSPAMSRSRTPFVPTVLSIW